MTTPERKMKDNQWLGKAIIGLGALVLLVGGFVTVNTSSLQDSRDNIASKSDDAATTVLQLCARIDQVGKTLQASGVCTKSAQVKEAAGPVVIQGVEGKQGPGPSDDQVAQGVADYISHHPLPPGQLPTMDMVIAAVTQVYNANKPADGKDATPEQIAASVADYCGNGKCTGKAGTNGTNGTNGANGADATDAQVAAQVNAYCDERGQCRGDTGAQGRGIESTEVTLNPDADHTGCFLIIHYDDRPSTTNYLQLRDGVCPPPTSETPSGTP